ncbi:hypothetical protein [Umezawaea sp. Da 62-37]|uniref:hypothetical protein n=1 Tax=Umezawaea sp. Da 62-37 TaxID=3075927 RepID=UPI0028F72851|nr:hypothetical protein [Umezawaea sp. Da 62-37]WNV82691.1 hypothetical protein RM788_31405 [Umezawaea sp. Da 62-37]
MERRVPHGCAGAVFAAQNSASTTGRGSGVYVTSARAWTRSASPVTARPTPALPRIR